MSNVPEQPPVDKGPIQSGLKPRTGGAVNVLPEGEDLLIVFQGLLSFCYLTEPSLPAEDIGHCEIGIFNQDDDHKFRIDILGDSGGQNPSFEYTAAQLRQLDAAYPDEKFRIEIVGATAPTAGFYEPLYTDPPRDFSRDDPRADPNDFRWLIDVESRDLYNQPVRNKRRFYRPKLLIKHGTFFTQEKTASTFHFVNRTDYGERKSLGSIAFCTAAMIKLGPDQTAISFTFKDPVGEPKVVTFGKKLPGRDPAKIFFTNLCFIGSNPLANNDFYHHFEAFSPPLVPDPPVSPDPYDLQVVNPRPNPGHTCGGLSSLFELTAKQGLKEDKKGTDAAPCHGMGYGQSGGGTG